MKVSPTDLRVILAALSTAAVAALAVDSLILEPSNVQITRYSLPLPNLPQSWEGAKVVHLTDLHYGDPRSERLFNWMVDTANAEDADLIVITGDYVVDEPEEAVHAARHLKRLRARHGVLGVMGDHDFHIRTKKAIHGLVDQVTGAGVQLIRNSALELPGGLWIAGVDPTTRKLQRADLDAALRPVPGGKPHLLLSHAPDIILKAAAAEVPVVLCGHTHGGQVVIPFYGPPITHSRVDRKYASGWSSLEQTRMYTGRGLASHYSLRFCCRPEVTVFTLHGA
ncbi:MAG: metallophosphoesterase [Actinomycetota bacterium]